MRDETAVARRLEAEVRALARPEGRRVGTPGHEVARRHLRQRLIEEGLEPYGTDVALPYAVAGQDFTNLVAVAAGQDRSRAPLLLGAHYDTAGPWPGADDNAASVALALEVAARLRREPAGRDVLIALFDAEEPPYFHSQAMGSTHFHGHQLASPVHAAFVLDLVGHAVPIPGAEGVVFVTGMESDPDLEGTVLALPRLPHARPVTALNRYVGDMSDHHAFRLARVPYLFWTCGRWAHYHRPSDTPEKLDYRKMASLADLLEHALRDAAGRSLDGPWEGYDTTATDVRTMREGLGPFLDGLGVELRTRRDVERVAALAMRRFAL